MIEAVRLFKQYPPKPGIELPEAKVKFSSCVCLCISNERFVVLINQTTSMG